MRALLDIFQMGKLWSLFSTSGHIKVRIGNRVRHNGTLRFGTVVGKESHKTTSGKLETLTVQFEDGTERSGLHVNEFTRIF